LVLDLGGFHGVEVGDETVAMCMVYESKDRLPCLVLVSEDAGEEIIV
jgi:hypothetical protein